MYANYLKLFRMHVHYQFPMHKIRTCTPVHATDTKYIKYYTNVCHCTSYV